MAAQIGHAGPVANPMGTKHPAVAPSRVWSPLGFRRVQSLSTGEIEDVIAKFAAGAGVLADAGFRLVSGGTDNHLALIDTFSKGVTGKAAEAALGRAGITVNKNAIPFDQNPPMTASGIRIGTPAVTTRGMGEAEMDLIGRYIPRVLDAPDDEAVADGVRIDVEALCRKFPLYPE